MKADAMTSEKLSEVAIGKAEYHNSSVTLLPEQRLDSDSNVKFVFLR